MAQGKILVTDDEEDILEIVADRLEFYGFEVRTARDGVECLEAIDQELPDLLLLDIRMPRLDGLGVLARLREDHPDLPVVVITASSERHVADQRQLFFPLATIKIPGLGLVSRNFYLDDAFSIPFRR